MLSPILAVIPFLFISTTLASVLYIGISTALQFLIGEPFRSGWLFLLLIGASAWGLRPHCRSVIAGSKIPFRISQAPLLVGAGCLILFRCSFYFHAIDDFVFHMVAGFLFDELWAGDNFMPILYPTYHYPLLQVIYSFSLETVGVRLSLLIFSIVQLAWTLSLNSRFAALVFPDQSNKRWVVDAVFAFLYFSPDLMLTHATFMTDMFTVLFALEWAYTLLSGGTLGLMGILSVGVMLSKQSGFFFAPFIAYGFFARIRRCTWLDVRLLAPPLTSIAIFLLACHYQTGNPFSYLFNGVFQSPLYSADNFRDLRWGPTTWSDIALWPLIATFSSRYIETNTGSRLNFLFFLFLAIPYVWSCMMLFTRQRVIGAVSLISLIFWSHSSGYARYHLSSTSVTWMFILLSTSRFVPAATNVATRSIVPLVLMVAGMMNFSRDYALRGSPLVSLFPLRINQYAHSLVTDGVPRLGKDTPRAIYERIKGTLGHYDAVAIHGRGIATFYAFLISYYGDLPLIQALSPQEANAVLSSPKISNHVKGAFSRLQDSQSVLLVVDQGEPFEPLAQRSLLFTTKRCVTLPKPPLVPEFPHENYFQYATQRLCITAPTSADQGGN